MSDDTRLITNRGVVTVYRLAAGLPGGFLTVVADYDDLSGECLTDAHAALRAGLVVSVEPCAVDADAYAALTPLPDGPFLERYTVAVLAGESLTTQDRDWLLSQGLVVPVRAPGVDS